MTEHKGNGPNPLSGVIRGDNSALASIQQRTRRLNAATEQLGRCLPARLQGQWQVAALSSDALVLSVTGSVWATPLRAHQQALLEQAGEWLGTAPAKLKIQIHTPPAERPRRGGPRLSKTSAQGLREAVKGMQDPKLAQALARLAARRDDQAD